MPSGGALFGSTVSRGQSKNLVEFKAGKMTMKGKMVHPDKRKGLVYVHQSDDSLMHFCWKDRQSGSVVDDLIIFPDDCEFKKVPQCTTGRVFVLKFKSSNRKLFFWLQEPKTEKDDENCRKVNEVLNNPPTPGSQRSDSSGRVEGDIQNLLSNMSQQQLMQLFGGQINQMGGLSSLLGTMSRPSTTSSRSSGATSTAVEAGSRSSSSSTTKASTTTITSSTTTTPAKSSSTTTSGSTTTTPVTSNPDSTIQLRDLQSLLSGLGASGATAASPASRSVDLSPAITSESLQAILNNPDFVKELQQHLPSIGPDGNQEEQLKSTLASPQFQQAVSMFSAALQSGQLGPVVQQFDVSNEAVAATTQGNMEEFVRALQNASISQQTHERPAPETTQPEKRLKSEEKKDEDDDVNME
uniref:Proteasomal ubiquitin receptor ADRM1 homolog n=1 Tax=Cacopsylla melanoneura TaxID=428564 RepID=A0A8D8VUX6_9HEMI